jgi:ribonuclease P protein component
MVLHFLPERPEQTGSPATSGPPVGVPVGPRAGFVVGKAVGNSVVRHRVTRRLRAVVRAELHRLPQTADLVVRARPEAGTATSDALHRDLASGLDRLLGARVRQP